MATDTRERAGGPFRRRRDRTRRVLVLQGTLAVWTLWTEGRPSAVHVERLDANPSAGCRCPWPLPEETFVDVVADSPLDDVERVLAEARADGGGRVAGGALSRWRLGRRLIRRHPGAAVRLAPAGASPLLAALLTVELPDDWARRLDVLQRGAVTIASLHSALRLREPTTTDRDGDVLQVTRGAGTERHLLFRSGCPAFTRVVSVDGPDESRAALDETSGHLALRHGVPAPRVVRGPGPPPGAPAPDGPAGDDVDASELDDAHHLAFRVVAGGHRRSAVGSTVPLDKWRRHLELRRLHGATALTATIAALTVLASAAHGIDSARRRAGAIAADEALALRVERLIEAIDERHPEPARADASLALLERHAVIRAPEARDVLALLAGVMTEHAAVRLDHLEWSTPEGAAPTDDGRATSAANQPLRRVPRAEADVAPAIARIEIAGRIDAAGALSVGERQDRFEAFVRALERDPAVDGLRVRLSPASAAATRSDGTSVVPSTEYALQMRYTRRP